MIKFKSINFKLAVINELIKLGHFSDEIMKIREGIENGKYMEYYNKCSKKEHCGPHPEIYEFFKNLELPGEYLDEVTDLSFDVGEDIYHLIAHNWDGEEGLFAVDNLEDVFLLKNLASLYDTYLIKVTDASPLLKLKNLQYVDTNNGYAIDDPGTLEKLEEAGVEVDFGDGDYTDDDEENIMYSSADEDDPEIDEEFELAQDYIWERGEPEKALAILDNLIGSGNDDADIWLEKGNAHDMMQDRAGAEKAWIKCIEIDPEYSDAYYNLANICKYGGRLDEALKHINNAIKNGMEEAEAFHIKGQVLKAMGDEKTSLPFFKKALGMYMDNLDEDPDDSETIFQLACVHAVLSDDKEALDYLKRAVSIDPSYIERANEDTDFERLRNNPDFKKAISAE